MPDLAIISSLIVNRNGGPFKNCPSVRHIYAAMLQSMQAFIWIKLDFHNYRYYNKD